MCRAAGGEEDGAVGVFSPFYVAVSFVVVVFIVSCCCFVCPYRLTGCKTPTYLYLLVLVLFVWLIGCFCSDSRAGGGGLLVKKKHTCYFGSLCVGSWRRRSG